MEDKYQALKYRASIIPTIFCAFLGYMTWPAGDFFDNAGELVFSLTFCLLSIVIFFMNIVTIFSNKITWVFIIISSIAGLIYKFFGTIIKYINDTLIWLDSLWNSFVNWITSPVVVFSFIFTGIVIVTVCFALAYCFKDKSTKVDEETLEELPPEPKKSEYAQTLENNDYKVILDHEHCVFAISSEIFYIVILNKDYIRQIKLKLKLPIEKFNKNPSCGSIDYKIICSDFSNKLNDPNIIVSHTKYHINETLQKNIVKAKGQVDNYDFSNAVTGCKSAILGIVDK